jgi:hypothetical protein
MAHQASERSASTGPRRLSMRRFNGRKKACVTAAMVRPGLG